MKSCRKPGGYSNGGTGYPLETPYASASGPVSENTGPDSAKTTPSKTSIERNASSKRRIMVPSTSKIDGLIRSISALRPYHELRLMSGIGTFRTWRDVGFESVLSSKADVYQALPSS